MPVTPIAVGGADKRVRIAARQRVDVTDFENLGKYERLALANVLSTIIASGSHVCGGLKVVPNSIANDPDPDDMTVTVQTGTIMDGGYFARLTSVNRVTVNANTSGSPRTDNISVRYSESETDTVARKGLTPIVRTEVEDEPVGTSDGSTLLYDLGHAGVIGATLIVRVGGTPVAHTLVPGTGSGGHDQIAFATPAALGGEITADYTWQDGGVEAPVSVDTAYASTVEVLYTAGSASAPAGYFRLCTITVADGASEITADDITDTRTYSYGADGLTLGRQFALGTQYARIGECGIDVTASGDDLVVKPCGLVINGVHTRLDGATYDASDLLADGLSLTNNTDYFLYACVRRGADVTHTPGLVLTTVAPDAANRSPSSTFTKTFAEEGETTFATADCIYIGCARYGTATFLLQKRIGDLVLFDEAIAAGAFNPTTTPNTLNIGGLARIPATARGVQVFMRSDYNHSATSTQIVALSPAASPATTDPAVGNWIYLNASGHASDSASGILPFFTSQNLYAVSATNIGSTDTRVSCTGYLEPLR